MTNGICLVLTACKVAVILNSPFSLDLENQKMFHFIHELKKKYFQNINLVRDDMYVVLFFFFE
jgi:hypothetical protein